MEYAAQAFPYFSLLSKEIRLKIWAFALPGPDTIEQVWNNSKREWKFNRVIPAILQVCSEPRAEFLRTRDGTSGPFGYRMIEDIHPFYLCYELDTIYVRRQFHSFDLDLMRTGLRFLQMDWGLAPYWWLGAQQAGPEFIRLFPQLETLTLVVNISRLAWDQGEKDILLDIIKNHTVAQFEDVQSRHLDWRMPKIHFRCKRGTRFWGFHSIAQRLLPENNVDTQLVYDWAKELS